VGEFAPRIGNKEFPYLVGTSIVCHAFAAVGLLHRSGRPVSLVSLILFWSIMIIGFAVAFVTLDLSDLAVD